MLLVQSTPQAPPPIHFRAVSCLRGVQLRDGILCGATTICTARCVSDPYVDKVSRKCGRRVDVGAEGANSRLAGKGKYDVMVRG